jgi:hypothetical protein
VDSHCDPQQLTSRPAQQTIMGKRHWGGALWVGWVAELPAPGGLWGPRERQNRHLRGWVGGWICPLRAGPGAETSPETRCWPTFLVSVPPGGSEATNVA